MLFRKEFLDGIRDGTITLAFRRWRRPTVKAGGSLLTAVGQLSIVSVDRVEPAKIPDADARRAGYASLEVLARELHQRTEGDVYRIELGTLGPDPRVAFGEAADLTGAALATVRQRLQRLDALADEPWTFRTLEVIRDRPGVRAGDLCRLLGLDKAPFKSNVRKLKALGLTESLEVGYRLSRRGAAVLDALSASPPSAPGRSAPNP